MDVLGATLNGGWFEYVLYSIDAAVEHKVSYNLSKEAACYVEPLANAIHGFNARTFSLTMKDVSWLRFC